jgi:hypothetical protein
MQRPAYYAHAHARFSGLGRAEDMPDACGGLALVLARLASSDQFSTYQHTGEPVSSFPGGVRSFLLAVHTKSLLCSLILSPA